MARAVERQYAVQTRILNHLHGVENTDRAEIAGEREMSALEDRLRCGRGFEIGATRAANGFEAVGDVESGVELFGFEQTIVRGVEIFAFDVEAREGEALARRLRGL